MVELHILDGIPEAERGNGYGSCGLPQVLSSALKADIDPIDPTGSQAAAMIVRSKTDHPKHGFPIGPCDSCKVLTKHYGLDFLTDDGK
ncbi:hypothetical protein GCM10010430_81370 [Kitasatospora cystarginea]|uniref:Transglycosylase SLT domain-containing protein n=1 Tax=Kitasatospora cystarginea TaxID=58350 RepID=A0ABN3F444_9ACTN